MRDAYDIQYSLDRANERADELERQLATAQKLLEQYRSEIRARPDLMEEGFCQGVWFEETYRAVVDA